MRVIVTFVVLALVAGGIFALGGFQRTSQAKSMLKVAEELPLTVAVAKPSREDIVRIVQAPGDVEAVLEVDVSSEIVAKILEMPVKEGDSVQQGDLLCRLDDKNLLADVESAKARIGQLTAAIAQTQVELDKAERDLARQIKLSEADATSDVELRDFKTARDRMRAMLDMREQELVQAEAGLKRIYEDLQKTVIRAPISGVISKLMAKQGEVVVTGTMNNPGTKIMTISDLSKMQVRARVDEVDIPLVQAGQPARVYLQSDQNRPVRAQVVRVASKGTKQVGRDVVNFEVMLEVTAQEDRVKPGMSSNVEIEVARSDNALTVPIEAVVHRMRKELPEEMVAEYERKLGVGDLSARTRQAQYLKVAFVMENDVARVRIVEPGIADTRRVEARGGLSEGDTVIVGPYRSLDQLKDGKKVALSDQNKKEKEKKEQQKEQLVRQSDSGAQEGKKAESPSESKSEGHTASAKP